MHLQGTLVYVLAITLIVLCVLDPTEANKKMKFKKKKRLADLNDQEVDKLYDEWEVRVLFSLSGLNYSSALVVHIKTNTQE